MAVEKKFSATITAMTRGGAAVEIPFDVEEIFGTKGRVKVKSEFNGHPYRGSITPMGGRHVLGITKDIRAAIEKDIGDSVSVLIEEDTEPRIVIVPDDFEKALSKNKQAKTIFDQFAYTHRKEYVRWIESAKKPETRESRIIKAVGMIAQNKIFS